MNIVSSNWVIVNFLWIWIWSQILFYHIFGSLSFKERLPKRSFKRKKNETCDYTVQPNLPGLQFMKGTFHENGYCSQSCGLWLFVSFFLNVFFGLFSKHWCQIDWYLSFSDWEFDKNPISYQLTSPMVVHWHDLWLKKKTLNVFNFFKIIDCLLKIWVM